MSATIAPLLARHLRTLEPGAEAQALVFLVPGAARRGLDFLDEALAPYAGRVSVDASIILVTATGEGLGVLAGASQVRLMISPWVEIREST